MSADIFFNRLCHNSCKSITGHSIINQESPRLPELSQKPIHHFVVFTQRILRHYRSVPVIAVSIPETRGLYIWERAHSTGMLYVHHTENLAVIPCKSHQSPFGMFIPVINDVIATFRCFPDSTTATTSPSKSGNHENNSLNSCSAFFRLSYFPDSEGESSRSAVSSLTSKTSISLTWNFCDPVQTTCASSPVSFV
jgi:hypothetical protein